MRRLVVFLWCLCLLFGVTRDARSEDARLQRMCKALDVLGNYDLPQPQAPHRLVQEIAQMTPRSPAARKALVKYAFATDAIAAVAVPRTPDVDVEDVVATFRTVCDGQNAEFRGYRLEVCLQVFGQMGDKAAGVVPFLLEELHRYQENPSAQGAILVVLANIGYDLPATTARLRKGLVEFGNAVESDDAKLGEGAVSVLSRTGAGAWFDDAMTADVLRRLKAVSFLKGRRDARCACSLVLVLMRLGDRVKSARPEVTRLRAEAEAVAKMGEEPGPPAHLIPVSRIIFGFCEWQMDPSNEEPLRQTLKFLETGAGLSGRAALEVVSPLLEDRSVAAIIRLLDDEDEAVVGSAARVCGYLGLRASAARPRLLRLLEGSLADTDRIGLEHLVYYATHSLAAVGSPEDIPRLQGLLDEVRDDKHRRHIERPSRA